MLKYIDDEYYTKYLINKIEEHDNAYLILKAKGYQLTNSHEFKDNVYILRKGIVKKSVLSETGMEININYQSTPGIINLLGENQDDLSDESIIITVKSQEAEFYQIKKNFFWKMINENFIARKYMGISYENQLRRYINIIEFGVTYSKVGSICAFFYQCAEQFGEKMILRNEEKVTLIHLPLTHEEIGKFCGINNRSSVTRIISKLKKLNILDEIHHYYFIKNMDELNLLKQK